MQYRFLPFSFSKKPTAPVVEEGKESIRIGISDLAYDGTLVQIDFQVEFLFPSSVADRYDVLHEALVLVVNDVEQGDCLAIKTIDSFTNFGRDERGAANMRAPVPLPILPRGNLVSEVYRGGSSSGTLSFEAPGVADRPTIFVYMILENYVSNVIGINLHKQQIVDFS